MASFAVDQLKSNAYDELAELAVATKTKVLRATESDDIKAILDGYFQTSIMIMRRTGTRANTVDAVPEKRWRA